MFEQTVPYCLTRILRQITIDLVTIEGLIGYYLLKQIIIYRHSEGEDMQ